MEIKKLIPALILNYDVSHPVVLGRLGLSDFISAWKTDLLLV